MPDQSSVQIVEHGVATGFPRVAGICPACGSSSLFVGSGGYVTCSLLGCREPCAASDMLESRARREYVDGDDGRGSMPPSPDDRPPTRYQRWVTPWEAR